MSSPQQQVVAVENALTGEKKFRTVHYAITGDDELDTLSGLIAVLNAGPTGGDRQLSFMRIVGVLEYLLSRYRAETEQHLKDRGPGIGPGFGYPPQGYVGGQSASPQITPQPFPRGLLETIMDRNRP